MAKKRVSKPKASRVHLFTGGNYSVGSLVLDGNGIIQFSPLKKKCEIGAPVESNNLTGIMDSMVFKDTRTVDIFINHLLSIKEEMDGQS